MLEVLEKKEVKKREIPMISPNRVTAAEHGRNIHLITAENGHLPSDFLEPAYYGNVSKNFRPGDHVEIRLDDMSYWAEFLVLAADRAWAKVHLLREVSLSAFEEVSTEAEFKVEWKGPHRKYCVIRLADSSYVHEGEQERGGANTWLEGYLRTIGKPARA